MGRETSPSNCAGQAKLIENFRVIVCNSLGQYSIFPGIGGRNVLPTQKPAHKLRRGDRLDLFAQRPDRQPMYAGQQSPVAPFDFVARSLRELTAQYCTARFE